MGYLRSSFSGQLPGTFEGTGSERARRDDDDRDNDGTDDDDDAFNDANREVPERYVRIEDCSYVVELVDYDTSISTSTTPNPSLTRTPTPPPPTSFLKKWIGGVKGINKKSKEMDKGDKRSGEKKEREKNIKKSSPSSRQPECVRYMNEDERDGGEWTEVVRFDFMDAKRTPLLHRVLYLPFLRRGWVKHQSYALFERK